MIARKQTVSELPCWFDIRNYSVATSFTIRDWHWNIFRRLHVFQWIQDYRSEFPSPERAFYESWLDAIFETPCMKATARYFSDREPSDLIRDMSVGHVMGHAAALHESEVYLNAWEAQQKEMNATHGEIKSEADRDATNLGDSINDFIAGKWPGSANFIYLEVDINAPIAELSASFAAWVQQKKKERESAFQAKKSFTVADFKKWQRYRLLPYFDLKLWAAFKQVDIPVWLYVKALFKDFDGDVDGIFRKDTRPHADKVFTWECLEHLANQVSVLPQER
jgi:hypothetical protein